jgi:hypothetical protein
MELEIREEGQSFTKLGRKYQHYRLYLQSIKGFAAGVYQRLKIRNIYYLLLNFDKHLPQNPLQEKIFDDILRWCLHS